MNHLLRRGDYFGSIRRQRSHRGLILTETYYEPNTRVPTHEHANPYFCLNLSVPFSEISQSEQFSVPSQSLLFHPPEREHSNTFTLDGGRCFNIEMESGWLNDWDMLEALNQQFTAVEGNAIALLAKRLFWEFRDDDQPAALVQQGIALELLGEVLRVREKSTLRMPRWVRTIANELLERHVDPPSIEELARCHNLHPVHLSRVFRKHQGCTIGEYICRVRIERACQLLAKPSLSLAEIAIQTGFADQSHFSNRFKRMMGTSPGAYRRSIR